MIGRVGRISAAGVFAGLGLIGVSSNRSSPVSALAAHPLSRPSAWVMKAKNPTFKSTIGSYKLSFQASKGSITVMPTGSKAGIQIKELGGNKKVDLLYSTRKISHSGDSWTLSGKAKWAGFELKLTSIPLSGATQSGGAALLSITLKLNPSKNAPASPGPDVSLNHTGARGLTSYAESPPVAGNNLLLSDSPMHSTMFYFADYTALGSYFDRTKSGVTEPVFRYTRAGDKGSLVGVQGGSFGYVPPDSSLLALPHHKTTLVVSSYLYLRSGIPSSESDVANSYLEALDAVDQVLPKPSIPTPDWQSMASKEAEDLADPANWVNVPNENLPYLRSYVSDTRSAPELITDVSVLAGLRAYEKRFNVNVPFYGTLDNDLESFFSRDFGIVENGLPGDPAARGESWYLIQNMISLLQLAQTGDGIASLVLHQSIGQVINFAHINNYEFPQDFAYADLKGGGSGTQPDVAGGYAWLMLGLYDLNGDAKYLDEAKASIGHVAGKGFVLSYETQMTGYAAAAAERLYQMTGDATYQGYARLALANLFHATRFWDCTYGACRKGSGYHTYMGLNPLPWSDYTAMLEQYQAWLGLQGYMKYAQNEPTYVTDLVQAFLKYTPLTLQYSLPPLLPPGVATSSAGEYPFVPHNNLGWYIPLEDLREGEATSGVIGQEIYGAGGPFMFAAYAP